MPLTSLLFFIAQKFEDRLGYRKKSQALNVSVAGYRTVLDLKIKRIWPYLRPTKMWPAKLKGWTSLSWSVPNETGHIRFSLWMGGALNSEAAKSSGGATEIHSSGVPLLKCMKEKSYLPQAV